jgi:DNA-binding NarL/FixJ family response regulator
VRLTDRQRELLEHLIDGAPNKHIARAMNVGESTVKMMLHMMYDRFGVRNRTELAMLYAKNGGRHANENTPRRAQAD